MKRSQNFSVAALLLAGAVSPATYGQVTTNVASNAMIANTEGYPVYRIPGFTVAADGSLLLFAEGRPNGSDPGGAGDINMVFKRSTDGGQTWSALSVLDDRANFDYSDPRVVIDQASGHAHLLYTQWPTNNGQTGVPVGLGSNSAKVYRQVSTDHGATWSGPIDITTQVKDPTWASINTGPGLGIQLQWQDADPSRNGRMIVPAHYRPTPYRGVALYSDDGGANWAYASGSTSGFTDEAEIIEQVNGDLLWDGRQSGGNKRDRYLSHDGGESWENYADSNITITPVDTGIVRYSAMRAGGDRDRILYSAPLGSSLGTGNSRDNIGVYTSYDEGKTLINPVLIESGSAAYSVVDRLDDGTIGLIYEVNHSTVRYINFDLAQLEGTGHAATMTHYDGFGNDVDRSNGGIGWSGNWQSQGNTNFTDANDAAFGGSSIDFAGLRLDATDGRVDLNRTSVIATTAQRDLATPIDTRTKGQHFFSFLVSQERDSSGDSASDEFLNVRLLDGAGTTQAALGVGSSENLFLSDLGSAQSAGDDSIARDSSYLFVAKLVTRNSADALGDQLFVKAFANGDALPDTDTGLGWTLVGTADENLDAVIESIRFESGSFVDWSVDELRVGTTFAGVVSGFELDAADINGDGVVGVADLDFVLNNWGGKAQGLSRIAGDLDGDRIVGHTDLQQVLRAWNDTDPPPTIDVPEPSGLGLLACGLGGLMLRRSRRL